MEDSAQRKDGLPKLREILRRQRDETEVSVSHIALLVVDIVPILAACTLEGTVVQKFREYLVPWHSII